jgi:hypothetical protein
MTTNQSPTVVERVHLICTRGNSYKFYDIELLRFGEDLYQAVGYNGRIKGSPADPQSGIPRPQSPGPVSYRIARSQFDALESDKLREYEENPYKPRYYGGTTARQPAATAPARGERAATPPSQPRHTPPPAPAQEADDEKTDRLDSLEF